MGRGLAGLLAAVFMVFGVFLVWAWTGQDAAAYDEGSVSYVEYEWDETTSTLKPVEKQATDYTKIEEDSADTKWGSDNGESWYVADSPVTISGRVTVNGDVHLILVNEASLTVNRGIGVPKGASFTVYGQDTQNGDAIPGKLTATANGNYGAGIGATRTNDGNDGNAGSIAIYGGEVTATSSGSYGVGIGGGHGGTVESIAIYGGQVTATSNGYEGVGIGGSGYYGTVESITIYGGQVTATSSASYGAGIGGGGGHRGTVGSIEISGGQVEATSGDYGAGIGGSYGTVESIAIYGGQVTATSTYDGAGIGSGYYGSVGSITVSGGTVTATSSGSYGAGIGGSYNGTVESIEISGGFFTLTAGSGAAALDAGAVVSGGVFADGVAWDGDGLTGSGDSGSQGAVYGVAPATGFYVVGNPDSALSASYPYMVVQGVDQGTIDIIADSKTYDGTPVAVTVTGTYRNSNPGEDTDSEVDSDTNVDANTGVVIEVGADSDLLTVACYADAGTDPATGGIIWSDTTTDCDGLVDAGSYLVEARLASGLAYSDGQAGEMSLDPVTGAFPGVLVLNEATGSVETSITPREITAVVSGDASKTYDGTTTVDAEGASSSLEVGLTDVVDADKDDVQLDSVFYEYDSPEAGTKTVNVTIGKLSGGKAGNYVLKNANTPSTYHVTGISQAVPIVSGLADGVQVESGTSLAGLADSATVTGVNGNTLPGAWTWTDQDDNPVTTITGNPGDEVTLVWTFTPDDLAYETVTGEVTLTITESITPGAGGDGPGTDTSDDPVVDTGGEDVTGDDAAVGTGSTDGGSSDDLAATGVDASLLALLGLAVLAGLSGLTMVARKHG